MSARPSVSGGWRHGERAGLQTSGRTAWASMRRWRASGVATMAEHLSGVSRVCPGFGFATLDRRRPYSARVSAICPGSLGLYARERARVCERADDVFVLWHKVNTLVTLDTLSSRIEVVDS